MGLAANMFTFPTRKMYIPILLYYLLLYLCFSVTAWPHALTGDNCPSSEWNAMCRPCCEYYLIQCQCPSKGSRVGYTVPCCHNSLHQCDPCIVHPACGGIIQRAQGHITLESYPTNARCEWTVQVDRGSSIELRFSLLSLESDHSCRYDYTEVRDGRDLSSPVIGRFCGDQPPPQIKSSGNYLHILFTSDGYNNFDGFALTFQESSVSAIKKPVCPPPEKPVNGFLLPIYGSKDELVSVNYQCHPPFVLTGSQQRTCLPNGTWSGVVPACVKGQTSRVHCAPLPKLLNGYHRPALDTAGGAETIEFFCKNSYILSGNHQTTCLSNGSWSGRPPKCLRACREPKVSELVHQSVVKPHLLSRYSMHDLSSAGFTPLTVDRQSNVERVDTTLEELPRGFHPVYTSIEYKCASALYHNTGSSRRTCLMNGRWSGRHVSCSPVCGKFNTFSTQNLTDTPWPWHAAIYIRSPPDLTASTHKPHGMFMSDQQGTSEESSFWYLACSGALLTQRSVLVTAQCVVDKDKQGPLHPAHMKVVIGMQYQASKDRMKSLHHLRVSEILVHPNFYSAPDFDVAVLKLKDKAKISERVLPVCLPKMQGGEVTVQEAFNARWTLPNNGRLLRNYTPLSQTELVELSDVAQCERAFTHRGTHTPTISDNTLCVIQRPPSPQSSCPSVFPGLMTMPAVFLSTSGVLPGHRETQGASSTGWQLLGLESFSYEEKHCNQQTYTVQIRIANFRDWIEKNMK
uniref:inactive serine protease PAMR1 isoform X2 n=1 Tax=Monopterus albus TaxID=43700 RepID=UPI0009B487A5|nr:inactive serine protease PAMR1-like isoform X2 [Monopterus albus]